MTTADEDARFAIEPEPEEDERAAIERAAALLAGQPGEQRSDWWRQGVREALRPPA